MKRPHRIVLVAGLLALLGSFGYATFVVLRRSAQLEELRQRAAQLAAESSALRRACDADLRNLAEAERQLAALPPLRDGDPSLSPERRTEIKAWLGRVKQLRRLFEERPDQRIPEMQFLTEQDWLRVTRNSELASDEGRRRALAAARDAAISQFTPQLMAALRTFARTAVIDSSPTIFALGPFFEKPVDPALLARYELRKAPPSGMRGNVEWSARNQSPIDPDYDSQFYVQASDVGNSGGGGVSAPLAWIPNFGERLARAAKDFAAAGKTPAGGLGEVLPFFNPPLAPSTVEKILKAERERQK
ncbi:MAG: hypothetical protein NTV51_10810 [Verrucomicrobia bacterium]|nr:hypothetical protein [Verrucomicrobiota bacterium]